MPALVLKSSSWAGARLGPIWRETPFRLWERPFPVFWDRPPQLWERSLPRVWDRPPHRWERLVPPNWVRAGRLNWPMPINPGIPHGRWEQLLRVYPDRPPRTASFLPGARGRSRRL
jgi:hypothetical protein